MKFVNAKQSKLERRVKYKVVKYFTGVTWHAERLRDWTWNHIKQFIKSTSIWKSDDYIDYVIEKTFEEELAKEEKWEESCKTGLKHT